MGFRTGVALACALFAGMSGARAMSLREAVQITVNTHPSIEAARADRRATGYELRQAQGRLLPTITLSGDVGEQLIDRPQGLSAATNNRWMTRRQANVSVRQVIFDGFDRANDIYKNAARIDSSALRVLDRSQTLGLSAVEAYIDVRRHSNLVHIARQNVARHREILRIVQGRRDGGKASSGEVDQARERVEVAKAMVAEIEQSRLEAVARFRQVVGRKPGKTRQVRLPPGLPATLGIAIRAGTVDNPAIRAAESDIDVARYERERSAAGYFPEIALEGTASIGRNLDGTPGRNEEVVGKITATWNIFDGLITTNRRRALAEREAQAFAEHQARIRETAEAIERAWAAYTQGRQRVASYRQQVELSGRVVKAYQEEYELSKRTLLDLLDSESAYFNSRFQLSSVYAVHLFSAYQLLASMGHLLSTLDVAPPPEAVADHRLQSQKSFGIFNIDIEPLRKE